MLGKIISLFTPENVQLIVGAAVIFLLLWRLFGLGVMRAFFDAIEQREESTSGALAKAIDTRNKYQDISVEIERQLAQFRIDGIKVREAKANSARIEAQAMLDRVAKEADRQAVVYRADLEKSSELAGKTVADESSRLARLMVQKVLSGSSALGMIITVAASSWAFSFVLLLLALSIGGVDKCWASGVSDSHHGVVGVETLLWPTVNFVLAFFCLTYIYKKYVASKLQAISSSIAGSLAESANELSKAELELQSAVARLGELDQDRQRILREHEHEGERLYHTILESAKDDELLIRERAERQVLNEKKRLEMEIRSKVIQQAGELAELYVREQLNPKLEQSLRDEAFGRLF